MKPGDLAYRAYIDWGGKVQVAAVEVEHVGKLLKLVARHEAFGYRKMVPAGDAFGSVMEALIDLKQDAVACVAAAEASLKVSNGRLSEVMAEIERVTAEQMKGK